MAANVRRSAEFLDENGRLIVFHDPFPHDYDGEFWTTALGQFFPHDWYLFRTSRKAKEVLSLLHGLQPKHLFYVRLNGDRSLRGCVYFTSEKYADMFKHAFSSLCTSPPDEQDVVDTPFMIKPTRELIHLLTFVHKVFERNI